MPDLSQTFTASALTQGIFLGALLGLLGQSVRVIVGLKKANDIAEQFNIAQLLISLLIGAAAGALAALPLLSHLGSLTYQTVTGLMGAGYAGADFIEGFMSKVLPGGNAATPAAPAPPTAAPAPANPPPPTAAPISALLAMPMPAPALDRGPAAGKFDAAPASSRTQDGSGGSTTTGLIGQIYQPAAGQQIVDASETLTAWRDGHSLGQPRAVQQVRTTNGQTTTVQQSGYPWKNRSLPDAQLFENHPGFDAAATGVFTGKATFFGKGDTQDEGTGIPMFGEVQTDSSVFGISLKASRLVDEGLALKNSDGSYSATPKGLAAFVEVYFPATRRLARLPLVDLGPGERIDAIADLTLAASAFLQNIDENGTPLKTLLNRLDNIEVRARISV